MKNKLQTIHNKRQIWILEILVGIILLAAVAFISANNDMKRTEGDLREKVNYIKEQCNNYNQLNLAADARSLMRVIESAKHVAQSMVYEHELNGQLLPDEARMEQYVQDNYLTGMAVLDTSGKILAQYGEDDLWADDLRGELRNKVLLDVSSFREKSYAEKMDCQDGSYLNLAACAREDEEGIIIAYHHTTKEYAEKFSLNFEMLLSGYTIKHDGTIVITDGNQIVASNDNSLEGENVDSVAILQRIKQSKGSGELLHANDVRTGLSRDFGMIERGRNYYVYAFLSERAVFSETPKNIIYALIVYIFAVIILNTVRWRTAQIYQKEQLRMQQEYADALQSKNEQLEQAVLRETKANAAKTDFLSRMTHDIRTPLNGIIGLLNIDEVHSDNRRLVDENRRKMMISANYLLSLINDMLQMSKLENNEIVLAHEWMDLDAMSDEICVIVSQRAADAGVTMEDGGGRSESLPYPYVYGSPLHLRQLFLNIYGNCIKYNKIGGKVWTKRAYIKAEKGLVTYQWTISDTGVGMSQEFLEHIFEPFSQERTDARSVYNGTGLGMAIVKRLVDKMNGTIEIKSEVGVGSEFIITLPFEIAEAKEVLQPENSEKNQLSIRGMHFLLAEDNALNAEIAEMLFNDEGADITLARNGQEAIDLFKSHEPGTYDAILMDIMMPLVDGYSATKAIRKLERPDAAEIPIIAMTANAFEEDANHCLDAGMNAHLTKPLQMKAVVETIAKCCKNKNN